MALGKTLNIAVIGSGISGLSAAWLLSPHHSVTLFEADDRLGGHGHTVDAPLGNTVVPVDTGFIVYNEKTYPNFTALLRRLKVPTKSSDMSFAVSMDAGALEYAGTDIRGLFAQKRNLVRPRFWSMLADVMRFYRNARRDISLLGLSSLDDYLRANNYGDAFREDHLYPMAAAIWSTPTDRIGEYPAAAMIRFCENHGLLQIRDRPVWRTIDGGSRVYIERLASEISNGVQKNTPARRVRRVEDGVMVEFDHGDSMRFDHVILASHADQSLALLDAPTPEEQRILGAFKYGANTAVLHSDESLMPRRRAAWASWNFLARRGDPDAKPCVTYWMNSLQSLSPDKQFFLTLNASRQPRADAVIQRMDYTHPLFDARAMAAQEELWDLQGLGNVWFCGAYFGSGFHEDGLQAGLAVAEELAGVRRPWSVNEESGRISIRRKPQASSIRELVA